MLDRREAFLRFFGRRLRFIDLRVAPRVYVSAISATALCHITAVISRYGRLASARIDISSARKLSDKITSVIANVEPRRPQGKEMLFRETSRQAKNTFGKRFHEASNVIVRAFGRAFINFSIKLFRLFEKKVQIQWPFAENF